MSSPAAAMPLATPTKSPKRRARSQKRKTGPTVTDLLLKTVSASTQRGGTSLSAMKKALKDAGYDVDKNKARILIALKRMVANKVLIQTKGTGASGSFKLNKNLPTPRKKKVLKKKKTLKKKAKRTSPKKAAGGATPGAKKSPKRKKNRTKAKSPNKAKKPAAAKRPKKTRSPKKAKRKVARSTKTRAAAKK